LGLTKKRIIKIYGDPVLTKKIEDSPPMTEALLYRHPTKYFSSDRVLLYLDEAQELIHWEYKPNPDKKSGGGDD